MGPQVPEDVEAQRHRAQHVLEESRLLELSTLTAHHVDPGCRVLRRLVAEEVAPGVTGGQVVAQRPPAPDTGRSPKDLLAVVRLAKPLPSGDRVVRRNGGE